MVYSYWNLRESPFNGGTDPRYFYESTGHEEALARLHFLVDQRRRMGLLLGESGVGKSLVLEVFARQKRSPMRQVVVTSLLGMTPADFLWQLAVRLGRDPAPTESLFLLWRNVADQLAENRQQHVGTVLLLDDADEADPEVLQQVVRIAQTENKPQSRLTIVLAAQSRRVGNLGRRLLELADLRIDIEPWSEADTAAYLRWSLAQVGRTQPVFTGEALRQIYELAEGLPRRVKQLADMALVAGAGMEVNEIDTAVVESVFHELGIRVPVRR
jgi:type II secretory pathway predicted ATPase ExeA